ncbi:G-protein coupled receptor 55-like isoform X1 [Hemiscyllium ocellatum]|uniref:G-protein coupled receptor 55-like isoform X1 n=2 Tax=Hemiscyllium ocellatum TaxID=170820 RepID=UPI0029671349|nr:G-protein coupled receptor 55-like isoform X1 [Hemiscyllium ocellatum]XP_060690278.1 G-protein coupled receptor 55-like isoform X1 [Hemiscyllium ocellatum]
MINQAMDLDHQRKFNLCEINMSEQENVMHLVIYIPTFILGLLFNLLALLIFCCKIKRWTETTIYMSNLALADILLLFSLPFKMLDRDKGWPFDVSFCSFVESLYFVNMYASIFIITSISIDRYFAIIHPLKARAFRCPRNTVIICLVIWAFVWLGSIPVYGFHDSPNSANSTITCFHKFSDKSWNPGLIAFVELLGFVTPMATMVFCSVRIIKKLLERQSDVPGNCQACITIIIANLAVFICSFVPVHVGIFLQFLVRQDIIGRDYCSTRRSISLFVQGAMCLANVNCCLDAICYYFVAKEFRDQGSRTKRSLASLFSVNDVSV